jgi:DNA-binding FrmR family transcriptional regulator
MVQAMHGKLKSSQLARLSRIEGQVRGVSRMVDEDRYCVDILTQIRAAKAALGKVEQEILRDHLKHCVSDAFHGGSDKERQDKIDELIELLGSRPA